MPDIITDAVDIDSLSCSERARIDCQIQMIAECPICHRGIQPKTLSAYYAEAHNPYVNPLNSVFVQYFCPLCRLPFLCEYAGSTQLPSGSATRLKNAFFTSKGIRSITPIHPIKKQFPESIQNLSPDFVSIFSQAQIAESENLSELCGIGYRKAIEFLVKDYLIHKFPEDVDNIKAEFLGNSISRISDARIKTLASRSIWIGNDETHYVRRHKDLGLDELKVFVSAMLYYIESELAFEQTENLSRQ